MAACLAAPPVTPPSLPTGVTIPIQTPPIPINLDLCCQIFHFTVPPIGPVLSVAIPPAVVTTLTGYIKALQAYYDQLQVSCPLD